MANRSKIVLSWFVSPETVDKALKGHIIHEEDIVVNPNEVPSACMDDNVDINCVRRYFDCDAWVSIQSVFNNRKDHPWLCSVCNDNLDNDESIGCDSCLNWVHYKCINLTGRPKCKYWYCTSCK